jgi:hypothetical protein
VLDPGEFNISWLLDTQEDESKFQKHSYVTLEDLDNLEKIDPLYVVKWKHVSYNEVTWEPLSNIQEKYHVKIQDFE